MNRRDRRAAVARGKVAASAATADLTGLLAEATRAYQQGQAARAEVVCRQILARAPAHGGALNLLGILQQASGNHRGAIKTLAKAVAANDLDASCHYNIAFSHQILGQRDAAAAHFGRAIALGLSGKDVEQFLTKNGVIVDCLKRIAERSSLIAKNEDVLGEDDIAALASDIFMRCALQWTIIRGVTLEVFFTNLRSALLRLAAVDAAEPTDVGDDIAGLFCALAQQCFLNEYVYAQGEEETRRAAGLRDLLVQKLSAGEEVSPLLLAAVAAYFPLKSLPEAKSLLAAQWPPYVAELIRRLVREPLEEQEDRRAITALTAVDDQTSLDVMAQYEENPYPRWTINPLSAYAAALKGGADATGPRAGETILIAGCGTGEHAFDIAQKWPQARILAIDLSRASLAYARRKTREEGLRNIEYAQADILKLGAIGRTFDRIEAVGVLHHLADPEAGWRVLLSLLAPDGVMRVGLYSELARRPIVEARTLIAARGYRPTAQDIRAVRQDIIRAKDDPRWETLLTVGDFYSMSGCRDMLFHVMEHRLTIPEIATFIEREGLVFLGFELDAKTIERFRQQHPAAEALVDLNAWNAFERANPRTFRNMYMFSIRKK